MGFTDKNELHIFQPRLMTNDQNFEMQFSVVSGSDGTSLTAEGVFRSKGDYGGMYWEPEDRKAHPLLKRPVKNDLTGITLEYDYAIYGDMPALDDIIGQVITVEIMDGTIHYVQTWNYVVDRPLQDWEAGGGVVFPRGRTPGSATGYSGHIKLDFDNLYAGWAEYEMVQVDEIVHTDSETGESWTEEVWEWVAINDTERWEELHSQGWALNSPSWEWYKLDSTQIKKLQWGFTSTEYNWENPEYIPKSDSTWFKMEFTNLQVTSGNSFLMTIPTSPYEEHGICFADDYDDNYDITPEWLLYQMYYLGFRDWINFYIGASHFYDKKGKFDDNGDPIPDPGGYLLYQYEMKTDKVFNEGFLAWYKNYLYWANYYGYNVVHSISMENVDAPESWWQRAYDGTPGTTMWVPTPKLLSFTNQDLQAFYKDYVKALCDISVEARITPIVQLGEPWWWIEIDENQPPCFYDQATKDRHLAELGYEIPVFASSHESIEGYEETLYWLRDKNGEFTHILRDHIRQFYPEAEFTVLFFPPSVLDKDRVPPMMRIANFPSQKWVKTSTDENLNFF
jgi:hypothetical protein